ncbi:hypothetical protein [Chitinophaga vietnamensis]|uniref:hypothetical protein n=1 Tax=Chitinophaga vietnamensis TaxID=2593957 RepID=UPI001177F930|nr:hypothetical protein [Chitinophaga vietnamensis]
MEKLLKEVRILKIYSLVLTFIFGLFVFMSFRSDNHKQRFEEIDVERINVIEKDGAVKLVISNKARQHPGKADGKDLPARAREAGMIFFDGRGNECGGLVYDADKKDAGLVFSVDQFRNDQIMQLQYFQELQGAGARAYGLELWDRSDEYPVSRVLKVVDSINAFKNEAKEKNAFDSLAANGAFGTERLFVGKTMKNEVGLFIRDDKGTPRIKIYVDKNNKTVFETFDENGKPLK